jgi:hypothetical protein
LALGIFAMKAWSRTPLLLALAGFPLIGSAGPFTNGGFASGFTGWEGVLIDFASLPPTPTTVDPAAKPTFYALPGGGRAEVSLDDTQADIGIVTLQQSFSIASTGNAIQIAFDWHWIPSDATADGFEMALADTGTGVTVSFVDLLFGTPSGPDYAAAAAAGSSTSSFTIAAGTFAGTDLTLSFAIADLDFVMTDLLRVGNISLTEVVASVPAPPVLALFGLGLLGLGRSVRRPRA